MAGVNGVGVEASTERRAGSVRPSLLSSLARAQYGAVVRMRWRMLQNSLRTGRGKLELGARVFSTVFFGFIWLMVGTGFGFGAYRFVADGNIAFLPLLLWPIFVLWQTLPIMVATAQESVDLGLLLRFPVGFGSYVLLYLFFGVFDLASLFGGIALLGVGIGVVVASPGLFLWTLLALTLFAAFNFLLTRMIFAWIERWLARRRTREILGMAFLAVFLGLQFLNPVLHGGFPSHDPETESRRIHAHHPDRSGFLRVLRAADAAQRYSPPGLATASLEMAARGRDVRSSLLLGGIVLYAGAAGALLGLRLRAEYRGESLGEAPRLVQARRPARPRQRDDAAPSATRQLFNGPISGILAKELRYLSRSGVMLFAMFTPLLVIFAMGGSVGSGHGSALRYAFPVAVAYSFLALTRQVCNSLGGEGAGIQLYFLSPTSFRTVMLAKNLLQLGLFCVELALAWSIVVFRFGPPSAQLAIATICWLLFALPAQLAAGNILSITMAYRMTLTRMSREQGAVGNGLLSLLIQMLIFAAGVAVYLPLALTGHADWAAPVFLLMAVAAFLGWLRILANVDRMAANRREALISTLVRAA